MKKIISIITLSLILLCGVVFTGCGDTSGPLSISLDVAKIEMLATSEPKTYTLAVKNHSAKVEFDFGFENNYAHIVNNEVKNVADGVYTFMVEPISAGVTTLKITLRGTNKTIDVPVEISEPLQGFTCTKDVFVLKGGSLVLTNSIFTFNPTDTTLKNISFKLKEDQDIDSMIEFDETTNTLTVGETTKDKVTFIATSKDDITKTCEFDVKIFEPVNTDSLTIIEYSQDATNNEEFDIVNNFNLVYGYSNQDPETLVKKDIELVTNDDTNFRKLIGVEFAFGTEYKIDVIGSEGIWGDISSDSPILNNASNFNFIIQANEVNSAGEPYTLTFRVYQADYVNNYTDVVLNVYATSVPKEIRINSKKQADVVNLYHNNPTATDFRFSVFPSLEGKHNEDNYTYSIGFYNSTNGKDVGLKLSFEDLSKYLTVTYGGIPLYNLLNDETGGAVVSELKNLSSVLSVKPIKEYSEYIVVKVDCFNNENLETAVCHNLIFIKIYKGTVDFLLNSEYENSTIYIPMANGNDAANPLGTKIFNGFIYDEGSTIGELIISTDDITEICCQVEQVKGAENLSIAITPIKVGTSKFRISTQNEKSIELIIVVFREINDSNFAIDFNASYQSNISSFSYKETLAGVYEHNTLNNIVLKGTNAVAYLKEKIYGYNDANHYSYDFVMQLNTTFNPAAKEYFDIVDNSTIVAKKFTTQPIIVTVTLNLYKIEYFKRVLNTEAQAQTFYFTLECIDYIKSTNIMASEGSGNIDKAKVVTVYDITDLSYINQNLAEVYIYLNLETCGGINQYLNDENINFVWEMYNGNNTVSYNKTTGQVGNIGKFYVTEYNDDGTAKNGEKYIAKFVCDVSGVSFIKQLTITLRLTDETFADNALSQKKGFESSVTVNIGTYVDVTSLYLTTATDNIYLDATENNKSLSIGYYVLPSNAMCKDIQIVVDSVNPSCVAYNINDDVITFNYISGGEGTIRIFPVSKMKTSGTKDEYGNYYYHVAISFNCADGTSEDRALKLSTYEDLNNINPNLHYFIESAINCGGKELYIPTFSGSIRGTVYRTPNKELLVDTGNAEQNKLNLEKYNTQVERFNNCYQSGEINNFIVKHKGQNSGLFGTMSGKLLNLKVEGWFDSVDWLVGETSPTNIGLLCGTNSGSIKDVLVVLKNNTNKDGYNLTVANTAEADTTVNVGVVAGVNTGVLEITNNNKISTMFVNITETFKANFKNNQVLKETGYKTYYLQANVAGVVGVNSDSGEILNSYAGNALTIGLYGINANVNLECNATFMGAVAGSSSGKIENLKVIGRIENNNENSYTGGIVGACTRNEAILKGNTTRVFIKSSGDVAGLVAQISGVTNYSNITKNKVQATDSGKIGLEASLLVKRNAGNIFEIAPAEVIDAAFKINNIAESYIDRIKTESFNQYLPIENYYGDLVITNNSENLIKDPVEFSKGTQEQLTAVVNKMVLAIYKEAEDAEKQQNLNNTLSMATLIKQIAQVNGNEFNIAVDKSSIVTIINFGKEINVNSTGSVVLTLTSSLNYKESLDITLHLTNYFEDYKTFDNKNHTNQNSTLNLINTQSKNVHLACFSQVYNYKNTPIELKNNTEVLFKAEERATSYLNITAVEQKISIGSKQQVKAETYVDIYPMMIVDGTSYFATKNDDIKAYIFFTHVDAPSKTEIFVSVQTGIENIEISKTQVLAEPSNEIEFDVVYDSYNLEDSITFELSADDNLYYSIDWEDDKNSGSFYDNAGNKLFVLTKVRTEQLATNTYKESYILKMELNQNNYLNYRNCNLTLVAKSVITNYKDVITITYNPETITAVIVSNYNYEDNEGMIDERKYDLAYYEQHMLVASSYSSTGEYNLLKGYVFTRLGEFDYLEVSMNSGALGGYLALGQEVEIEVEGNKILKGVANKNVIYTSIEGTVTLLAAKQDIISDDLLFGNEERMLEFTIIYSLPNALDDDVRVPITLTFYKNTEAGLQVCYEPQTTYVVSRMASRVEISIADKEQEVITKDELDLKAVQAYSVVKGKTYPLNVEVFGYKADEIVIESASPNIAMIENIDGNYYLTISTATINYADKPYLSVYITSYGQKLSNNEYKKGKVQVTALRIYEFLLNSKNVFESDVLSLRTLTTVDLRDSIISMLNIESAINNSSLNAFKNDFKTNADWKMISSGVEIILPTTNIVNTTYYRLNGFEFQPTKIIKVAPYQFIVEFEYTYKNGMPTFTVADGDIKYYGSQTFNVEVYINTTEELPAPIDTYEDLISVKNGEYYILTSDITVPGSDFNMITTTPKMLDGNGYKIIIKGDNFGANLQNVDNFALFEQVGNDCIFKNINIVIENGKKISIDNNHHSGGVNVGILAAVNNGIITNCSISCENTITVTVLATVSIMENSYFGTICAVNRGYITNSRVVANIKVSGVSVGGFVCNNEGQIASCYVKNSRIANEVGSSNENITTGGFVCNNTGKITMSYIEGKQSTNKIFTDYTLNNEKNLSSKIIYTSSEVGGFAYKNTGEIADCYANIPVVSSNRCAGFVAINNNKIVRCFSLSKMKQKDTLNYGFVITNDIESYFEDCYFVLEKGLINEYTSGTNYATILVGGKEVITGVIPGVEPLGIKDFSIVNNDGTLKEDSPFKNYLIGNQMGDSTGVWFYVYDQVKTSEMVSPLQSYTCAANDFKVYDPNTQKATEQAFNAGVLQLSSPNLISTARRTLNINADETYTYSEDDASVVLGTRNNPYLISNAKDLETYCNQKSKELQYYRLICDIDYEEDGIYSSNLYSRELYANFEGNNFSISGYVINSKTAYLSAGLFSKFGKENSGMSTLKNVNFNPGYINLPNTTFVGGIAGSAIQANIYNVSVNGANVVIAGKNFVGGLFGRTSGTVSIKNVYSDVVAKSSQFGSELIGTKDNIDAIISKFSYTETTSKRASSSYAGAVIGHVGGTTKIYDAQVGENAKAIGVMAGLMFGGIGGYSAVSNITLELNSYNNTITAYAFGGIVAGENKGTISNVNINSDIINKKLFTAYPIFPIAIGGIVGLQTKGLISNITSNRGYTVIGADFTNGYAETNQSYIATQVNNPYVVKYVGGIAGYGKEATIKNIRIIGLTENADGDGNFDITDGAVVKNDANTGAYNKNEDIGLMVMGANYVGGVVGYAETLDLDDAIINLIGHKEYINQDDIKVDEMIYMSYISEVATHLINTFSTDKYIGAIAGFVKTSIDLNSNSFAEATDVFTYYALYENQTEIESELEFNSLSGLYMVGNKMGGSQQLTTAGSTQIVRTYLSLISGENLYVKKA